MLHAPSGSARGNGRATGQYPTLIRSLGAALSSLPRTLLGTIAGMAIELAVSPLRKCRRVKSRAGAISGSSLAASFGAGRTYETWTFYSALDRGSNFQLDRPPSLGATPSRSRRSANGVIVVRKRTGDPDRSISSACP